MRANFDTQVKAQYTANVESNSVRIRGGNNNAKGSWFCVASEMPFSATFHVRWDGAAATVRHLLDFGVGLDQDSVQPVVRDMLLNGNPNIGWGEAVRLPILIPSGTRLWARCQGSDATSRSVDISVILLSAGESGVVPGYATSATYGVTPSSSSGTLIDPGTTTNTFGAWTQIEAAIREPARHLAMFINNRLNATMTDAGWSFDIGIGPAGEEVPVVPNVRVSADGNIDDIKPSVFEFPVSIPANARVAVRARCTTADATDRLLDVALITFY